MCLSGAISISMAVAREEGHYWCYTEFDHDGEVFLHLDCLLRVADDEIHRNPMVDLYIVVESKECALWYSCHDSK